MKRQIFLAFVVLMSVLTVTAAPAAASHVAVVSSHTSAADFNAATLTGNMYVAGSGESATVSIDGQSDTVSFSNTGSEQTFSVPNGENEVTIKLWGASGRSGGGTGSNPGSGGAGGYVEGVLGVSGGQTIYVYVGETTGFNGGGGNGGGATDVRQGGNTCSDRSAVAAGGGGGGESEAGDFGDGAGGDGGQGGANTGEDGGSGSDGSPGQGGTQTSGGAAPRYGQDGSFCQGGGGGTGDDGMTGGGGGGGWYGGGGGSGDDSFTDGDAASGGGGGSNYVGDFSSVISNQRGANSGHGQAEISYTVGDVESTYIGANHSVEGSVGGNVEITEIVNGSVTITWEGWDGSSWTQLDQITGITTTGTKSSSWSEFTASDTVRVNVTATPNSGSLLQFTMADEDVEAESSASTFDNTSASPTGTITTSNPDLQIDVEDPDFAKTHGDEVNVSFYTNRSGHVGSDILTSNSTASSGSIEVLGGDTDWWAWANDSTGHTVKSNTFTFTAPSQLEIRNETNHTQLIDDVNVTVEFYFDRENEPDLIVEKETSDGTVDFEGLPIDEPFVVVASADGYFNRRIFVPSLFEAQTVYLLNENESAVQPTFELVDFTGNFPQDQTVIEIQRNINGSWVTVEGDFFGASGEFSAQLAFNERHRIIITNVGTGESRNLGPFTPVSTSFVQLEIHQDDTVISARTLPRVFHDPTLQSLPSSTVTVGAELTNESYELQSYHVKAILVNETTGSTQLFNLSGTSSGGETLSQEVDLTGEAGSTVIVWGNWTATNGFSNNVSNTYIVRESFDNEYSLLNVARGMADGVPSQTVSMFTAFIALLMVIIGTTYSATMMSTESASLVGLGLLGGFMMLGWVPFGWFFAAGLTWAALTALRRGL